MKHGLLTTLLIGLGFCTCGQSLSGGVIGGSGGGWWLPSSIYSGISAIGEAVNSDAIERPRDFEPRLLFGLGVNFEVARLQKRQGSANTGSNLGAGGLLELGGSLTWRDRMSLTLEGQWGINGYVLRLDTVLHRLVHSSKRVEARLALHTWPQRNKERQWRFGLGAGLNLQRADEVVHEQGPYRAVTRSLNGARPYVLAEIGRWGAEGRDRFEVALRFVKHVDGREAWQSTATYGASEATYTANDDYLGVITRYHLGFDRDRRAPPPAVYEPDEGAERDTLASLTCRQPRITVKLWDDAEVDGDTVMVLLNERPVGEPFLLGKQPMRLALDLVHGTNRIEVVALNEGRIAPNTARCQLRRGRGKETLLVKTSRKRSQVLVIKRQ